MLRKYIEKQLAKCTFADLSNFDKETNTFHIAKYTKPTYAVHKCYVVSLTRVLLDPNSVWAVNWNSGSAPPWYTLKIYVSKVKGKMIYVESVAYDIPTQTCGLAWAGWLPIDELTQLATF